GCAAECVLLEGSEADELPQEEQKRTDVLSWRRTSKDPFAGQWEQILAWVQANPTRSSGDILRELQSQFPGRYEHLHLRTLQRGVRKIRMHVFQPPEETGSPEGGQENLLLPPEFQHAKPVPESLASSALLASISAPSPSELGVRCSHRHQAAENLSSYTSNNARQSTLAVLTPSKSEPGQIVRRSATISARSVSETSSREKGQHLTIERAIQQYLQAHRKARHRPKTLEWHQMVLSHLQRYLRTECPFRLVQQITETSMRNWLASLEQTPTTRGAQRPANTVATYARSARAFCGWLVEREVLLCSPLSENIFPRISVPLPHVVSPAIFEQVMRTGFSQRVQVHRAKRLIDRDRALLWVLFDTGITLAEFCALRVADWDQQTGLLRIRGKGGKERLLSLGATCQHALRSYLRQMDSATRSGLERRQAGGDPLFGSQAKEPLTKNGVTMVFARFRKRAGISETAISPQVLRHSFALRYLRAGGDPHGLRELLGYEGMAPVRQYLRWYEQVLQEQVPQENEET
ncbi:MAG TPA: tyrosine-type recombinase/integrase, partial [Ktedonobacteraceae bacterium]|nr:tyrosine-type recombinase/integrase [Ktedonobacteraceae bacterium]